MSRGTKCLPVTALSTIKAFEPAFYDAQTRTTYTIAIPDAQLTDLEFVNMSEGDVNDIPKKGGCYWIVTDAPITHCLNSGQKIPTTDEDGFTVIYNGVVSNSLRQRATEHLLRKSGLYGEMSGLSIDLICQPSKPGRGSHAKCAWSPSGRKLPRLFIDDRWHKVTDKQVAIDTLFLTDAEREYLANNDAVFFKNGININDPKHCDYTWKFVYCTCEDNTIRSFIETQWRKAHGVPQLCSYISGR